MPAIVFNSVFKSRRALAALKLSGWTAQILTKLRAAAPYALIELILPGGSVMALLLWLYRRRKRVPALPTEEILALL